MYYNPIWFKVEELVSPDMFERYRDRQHILWQQLDPRLLWTLDALRTYLKRSIFVNTWFWQGGQRRFSGLRLAGDEYYSPTSQHSHGRAADIVFPGINPEELRVDIVRNPQAERYKYITCIEKDTPTWLHIDVRNFDKDAYGVLQVEWK